MKSKLYFVIGTLVALAMLLAACAPAATPVVVEKTVVVVETSIVEVSCESGTSRVSDIRSPPVIIEIFPDSLKPMKPLSVELAVLFQ